MKVRSASGSGLRVSELALGTLTFGREADESVAARLLDCFLDVGGTLVDTADSYHVAEDVLGRLLPTRRHRVLLATKVGLPVAGVAGVGLTRAHIRNQVDRSLRRLGTDHIDLYQMHLFDPFAPLEETLSTMDGLVREGKVRYVGVSNWTAWQITKARGLAERHGWAAPVSVSPEYSLVSRGADRELLPMAVSEGMAVLPWAPLGGGLLSGKYRASHSVSGTRLAQSTTSGEALRRRAEDERNRRTVDAVAEVAARHGATPAQIALAWVLARPGVTSAVVGVRTLDQLEGNLRATELVLPGEDLLALDRASRVELGYPHEWVRTFGLTSPTAGPALR